VQGVEHALPAHFAGQKRIQAADAGHIAVGQRGVFGLAQHRRKLRAARLAMPRVFNRKRAALGGQDDVAEGLEAAHRLSLHGDD